MNLPLNPLARLRGCTVVSLMLWGVLQAANAATVTESYLQGLMPIAPEAIKTLGPDLFGDKVNLYNGALTFEQTDLDLPGNSNLPVRLGRQHVASRHEIIQGQFGDWDLQVPSVSGMFLNQGWVAADASQLRCSRMSIPPPGPPRNGQSSNLYWQGNYLNVPGAGSQEILFRASNYTAAPNNDPSTYRLVTQGNWAIGCLPSAQNFQGEGFIAISPSGVRYRFDWMASRIASSASVDAVIEHFLYATEVADRYGNWVRYTYDAASPMLLTSISSSDGRVITLSHSNGRITSATDGTRLVSYSYSGPNQDLTRVTQADGSAWVFDLAPMRTPNLSVQGESANCQQPGLYDTDPGTGTITHPSGAVGQFTNQFRGHGKTWVDRYCRYYYGTTGNTTGAVFPKITMSRSITAKTISGPGMPTLSWTYAYSGGSCWTSAPAGACTSQSSDRKTVTVTKPDGGIDRHIFGNRWRVNEGQLLQLDEGWNGATALRTTTYRYRNPANQAYPEQFGTAPLMTTDWLAARHRPLDQKVIYQQGVLFNWELAAGASGLDAFARPVQSSHFSSLGYSKGETLAYFDQTSNWVLGQVASVTDQLGRVRESTTYDTSTALPTTWSEYGRLVQSYEHHTDGNLYRVLDPVGRASTWTNYERGLARNVTHRDGAQESAVINNLGKPVSHTNPAGTTTTYGYDVMGRLNRIDPPAESNFTYHPILDVFEPVAGDEFGIGAGHWRQTTSQGNAKTVRYYDALWRVRLTQTFDSDDTLGTSKLVEYRYDHEARKTFESYPQRTLAGVDTATPGKYWTFDPLHRESLMQQDSELGILSTTTDYLGNFRRRVTSPRGNVTTFDFQAFDQPSQDRIAAIQEPESVWMTFTRDTDGKPSAITRGGTYNGISQQAARRYVYDSYQRLCKTIEPETGATVQAYDTAGNVAWRASGLALPGTSTCDQGSAPAARMLTFGYDARDRLTSTTYGDGSPAVTRSYYADGRPRTVISGQNYWGYDYNNRRLMTTELYSWGSPIPGDNWRFGRTIDAYGHVAALSDPLGTTNYTVNALGQTTQIGGYASSIRHHPNGSVAGYTLSNGISHTVSLNTRGLPEQWRDGALVQDQYFYDAEGNVSSITDQLNSSANRSMGYDGLNRLTTANGLWSTGTFAYDALDNVRASTIGSRTLTHNVDPATNLLTGLSGSQNVGMVYDANGNVVQRGAQLFSFDIGNRLSSAANKGVYSYDGHGRRSVTWLPDGRVRMHAYGTAGKLLFSYQSDQGGTRYVYVGDKLIAEQGQSGVTYSHTDALGSPVARTTAAGALASSTYYEPYGATAAGTVPTTVGFTGHVNDLDTGLVYMQQRYYDPIAGRFLSVDQITTGATDGSSFNRYAYGNNNPYFYVDPDGRQGIPGAVYGAISGAVGGWVSSGDTWQEKLAGVTVGTAAGALVGLVVPQSSGSAGALAAGIWASNLGQVGGSSLTAFIANGSVSLSDIRVDPITTILGGLGSMVGAKVGGVVTNLTERPVLGSILGQGGTPTRTGVAAGAAVEGIVGGATERVGPKLNGTSLPPSNLKDSGLKRPPGTKIAMDLDIVQ